MKLTPSFLDIILHMFHTLHYTCWNISIAAEKDSPKENNNDRHNKETTPKHEKKNTWVRHEKKKNGLFLKTNGFFVTRFVEKVQGAEQSDTQCPVESSRDPRFGF